MSETDFVHVLPSDWTFWVIKGRSETYEIEQIVSFRTIEQFWNSFVQFRPIEEMKTGSISLFKGDIKPAWEDPRNKDGQSALYSINGITSEQFQKIILTLISGTFEKEVPHPNLCGIVIKVKGKPAPIATITIWLGPGEVDLQAIGRVLDVNPNDLSLKPHPTSSS